MFQNRLGKVRDFIILSGCRQFEMQMKKVWDTLFQKTLCQQSENYINNQSVSVIFTVGITGLANGLCIIFCINLHEISHVEDGKITLLMKVNLKLFFFTNLWY